MSGSLTWMRLRALEYARPKESEPSLSLLIPDLFLCDRSFWSDWGGLELDAYFNGISWFRHLQAAIVLAIRHDLHDATTTLS